MTKPNPHRLIDPTKNEDYQRRQREREEKLQEMLRETLEEKSEINPKYVDGEPVCGGKPCKYYSCYHPCLGSPVCRGSACRIDIKVDHTPCLPALRRDRDAALERERELQREIVMSHADKWVDIELAKLYAKQRGWPDDLFDGKDGE